MPEHAESRYLQQWTLLFKVVIVLHRLAVEGTMDAEPTNNRAERSLRPAVISGKISCGNKTDRGRWTWQVLAGLAATCVQRGNDLIDYLTNHIPLEAKKTG